MDLFWCSMLGLAITGLIIAEYILLEEYPNTLRFGVEDDYILIPHGEAE